MQRGKNSKDKITLCIFSNMDSSNWKIHEYHVVLKDLKHYLLSMYPMIKNE